jgi:sulfate adenylyltransferase subunit 1 (EFTu-like GTPase family)
MDLEGYAKNVYDAIVRDFRQFSQTLRFADVTFVPVSALKGDNVVSKSQSMGWYDGPTVLEYLESVPTSQGRNRDDFRYPVQ